MNDAKNESKRLQVLADLEYEQVLAEWSKTQVDQLDDQTRRNADCGEEKK